MEPTINPRFIIRPKFGMKVIPMLTADGYVDYAHQVGLMSAKSDIIQLEKAVEEDGSTTRWCTVKVTVYLKDGRWADGIACVSTRDKFVKVPGYEVAVAETRALKRAIAVACNITDAIINPGGKTATREFVDLPMLSIEDEEEFIPKNIKKTASEILGNTNEDF